MTGFRGQKFDFTGEDGAWYAVVSDLPHVHLNMRVTAPVPSVPEITYITGISIITTDADDLYHTIVISVSNPHSMESVCSLEMPSCLAEGALHVVANGEEIMLTPGEVTLAPGVAIAAVNLPGECRSFGFEKYWEQKKLQLPQHGRRLIEVDVMQDMSDWVLADPTATNMMECEEYVAKAVDGAGMFEHQSEHASFQIMTPTATIRLSHGRLHQLPMRDPTDQYDLPDHLAWQMNLAIDHNDISLGATGILGETLVPTRDQTGAPIMQGMDAIRGDQEDCEWYGRATNGTGAPIEDACYGRRITFRMTWFMNENSHQPKLLVNSSLFVLDYCCVPRPWGFSSGDSRFIHLNLFF